MIARELGGLDLLSVSALRDRADAVGHARLKLIDSQAFRALSTYELGYARSRCAALARTRGRLSAPAARGSCARRWLLVRAQRAPPHVELELMASGDVPGLAGLRYRVGGKLALSRVSPYAIGPWQSAVDETTPYELAPLRRRQLFIGVEYQLSR